MTNQAKLFITLGCILILIALVMRVTWMPFILVGKTIRPSSLLILANTAFILALLSKK